MDDLISRQAAIELVKDVCDAIMSGCESWYDPETKDEVYADIHEVDAILKCNKEVRIALRNMPSAQPEVLACGEGELIAQPEIIRCNDCKHWTQTTGNMRGFGLGDCDYINAKLVNCNGFCYWAERRTDG